MADQRATIVLTSIFELDVLDSYMANFRQYGHLDQVDTILVPDKKTPESVAGKCASYSAKGFRCQCPSLSEQETFLKRVGITNGLIPWNSDNRRNVGFLMALESGTDFIISIDDDNYCTDSEDFFAEHAIVCSEPKEWELVESATGFLNICDLLDFGKQLPVYARGFPYFARHKEESWKATQVSVGIHVNAGLWLLDPDVDAITWLTTAPRAKSFKDRSVVLGASTWSPVNTQNTALRQDAIPAYYYIRMGYSITGMPIDRYGDIFSGYFTEACVKHLGGFIRAGTPVAEHRRNSHNYIKDANREWAGILILEDLLPWLREVQLSGNTYLETYLSLSHALEDAVESFNGGVWTDATRGYFHQTAYHMRVWLNACRGILGN